jgi:hypothetical protein
MAQMTPPRAVESREILPARRRGCYHYYRPEDGGIFWSNDPAMSIGRMIRSLGLADSDACVERIRLLQDEARGGPPVVPQEIRQKQKPESE